jgi:hypothetical protein
MKIAFLTRIDAFSKYGGDTYQLKMYCEFLAEMNHEAYIYSHYYLFIAYCLSLVFV